MDPICDYGCSTVAKYKLKNGKNCCEISYNKCPEMKRKNKEGIKKAYSEGRKTNSHIKKGIMNGWKNKTEKEIESIQSYAGKTRSIKYKTGELIPHFTGKNHTKESRQKISDKMSERNNGYIKTQYFEIYSPYMQTTLKTQGTYETKYAEYLNENKINWIRSRTISLRYKLHENDYTHTYYPDFYLPDSNTYVEIKGYFWKMENGRVDDKRKMERVKEQNPDKKILILARKDLKELGIKIK